MSSDATAPTGPIDWAAAVRTGQRLAPSGPRVTRDEVYDAVADLRRFAGQAELRVRETTGIGQDLPVASAEVVDRRRWIAATAEGMEILTRPLTERLAPKTAATAPATVAAAGSQVGALLGYLSSRVLGQYDPVSPHGGGVGRLLLVAPNIIKVEREIGAVPTDFRLWVCLHESTHRLQFQATGWMTDYFRGLVDEYSAIAPTDGSEVLRRVVSVIRGRRDESDESEDDSGAATSWLQRIQTPEQRAVFDKLMALMTLLEGHADYVMDAVGPTVIPTVDDIRAAFSDRRKKGRGPLDRIVRKLLGMDAKLQQYVRGAAFVRGATDRVGMESFNAVWASPENLPTLEEIADPAAWVRRVHG